MAVGLAAFISVGAVFAGWQGVRSYRAWQGIERVEFNPVAARQRLPASSAPPTSESADQSQPAIEYDTVLAIGSDQRPEDLADRQPGAYADAVLFYLAPTNGDEPLLVSVPRDLMVTDPCTGLPTKLNRTLEGCGDDVSGAEHVALALEGYTGIEVDHYAAFGFDAFTDVVDSVGGIEICVEHALRHADRDLLPAGCSVANGATTLLWIRSRTTQEFVDGEWRFVENVSDATRSQRQQQLMLALLARLNEVRSITDLTNTIESLSQAVVLDELMSLGEAVSLAWSLRGMPPSHIRRLIVPTEVVVLDDGSFALRATTTFAELLQG